ncbi:hypothetical protein NH287_13920 [Microbacterium sp. CnD16-F]|uniref:hypothetical protein n=1 Tax=Microbacterium TaxID=33882 RepID=UPI0020982C66|nr:MULTISPECIES: hypothetical protein [unclassified Microbacterium]MCO7204586.1 hypothetical protein [Microbacterium sp. CnD16-F]MDT0188388.1 hypothetical protein [Microbacterium sp. ARD31]
MSSRRPRIRRALVGALAALTLAGAVTACAPEPDAVPPAPTDAASGTPSPTVTPVAIAEFPFGPSTSTTPLPKDCESILTPGILDTLQGIPLNAPGMGGGIRPDSSRVCVWADPGASRTSLVTVVGYSPEREARDALYLLGVDEGYTCYEPDEGLRCEKSGTDELGLPVGRTVYWRDGVAIDTQYSNLAPQGYTAAIVRSIWG